MTDIPPPLVFVGALTTSTRHDARAREIGLIIRGSDTLHIRGQDGPDKQLRWFSDPGNADRAVLQVGRFHVRHPQLTDPYPEDFIEQPEESALYLIEHITRGAILVTIAPDHDAHVLADRMRWHDLCPSWTAVVDVVAFAAGAIGVTPPWNLDALATAHGIRIDDEDRRTALGRARLASSLYDAALTEETL